MKIRKHNAGAERIKKGGKMSPAGDKYSAPDKLERGGSRGKAIGVKMMGKK